MSITRIRVPCRFLTLGAHRENAIPAYNNAEFSLGLGPCGKTVEVLDVHFHAHGVEIVQVCTCTERKVFVYPWHTITGRVEVTHG